MTTNQDAINAGTRAMEHRDLNHMDREYYAGHAAAAYAAMAPIIRSEALREAAEVLDNRNDKVSRVIEALETKSAFTLAWCWSVVRHDRIRARWLRARAAGIEAGK